MATKQFSARWDERVLDRLDEERERRGLSRSRLSERYVDEGTRMDRHPGIVFRDGPAGRRAALAGRLDVWQVIEAMRSGEGDDARAIRETAEALSLAPQQVETALRYYREYTKEIDDWLRRNREAAEWAMANLPSTGDLAA